MLVINGFSPYPKSFNALIKRIVKGCKLLSLSLNIVTALNLFETNSLIILKFAFSFLFIVKD